MTIEEIRSEITNKIDEMQRALDADNVDKAESIKAEIAEYQEMIKQLEEELAQVEAKEEKSEESDTETTEDEQEERNNEETETEENQNKLENEGERKMTEIVEEVVLTNTEEEVRTNFQNFIMNNEVRDLTTESGAVIVPEYIGTQVKDLTDDIVSLDKFVTVESVNTKSGTKPVFIGDAVQPLQSVAELAENPKLGVQPLTEVDFKVETYRGYIPVSRETIEDGNGAEALVKSILSEAVVATRNAHILAIANTFDTTEVADLDSLKDVINVDLKPRHKKNILMSQSVYNAIDKLKDGSGQYLLQNSIASTSGKQLFGMSVEVLEDELIGANTMYVGNLAEAIVLFDRSQYSAQWTMYMNYGEALMVAVRHQAKELNKDAVRKINFTVDPAVEG